MCLKKWVIGTVVLCVAFMSQHVFADSSIDVAESLAAVSSVADPKYIVPFAEQNFAQAVGPVTVGDAKLTTPLRCPCITFGADMATWHANDGLKTKPGSIFANLGLNFEFYVQDDPYQQARDYMEGKTPFFRGTYRMCEIAAELFGSDPRTKPYMLIQKTFSLGDHAVGRERIKTIEDFKGAKVCLQACGPHVGFLYDILKRAKLNYSDLGEIIWAKNLTGEGSPPDMFRKDPSIDIAFMITTDMIALTGGLQNIGSGAETTVKGARVVVSTAEMNFSIADVYLVRKDFWDKHSDFVTKFAAGILKSQEEILDLRKAYASTGSKKFLELCKMGNEIYKLDFPPESEDGSLGMIMDCTFVGHPGNVAFFTDKNNPHGFDVFQKDSLDMVISRGYAKTRQGIFPSPIDWNSSAFGFLTMKEVKRGPRFKAEAVISEVEALISGVSGKDIIEPFTIQFEFDSADFNPQPYAVEFEKICDALGKFGNAVMADRGHVDPYLTLGHFVAAGTTKINPATGRPYLSRTGSKGNYSYFINGKPLDLASTKEIIQLIESGAFDGDPKYNPREVMQAAQNTSRKRAENVRDAIIKYAKEHKNMILDASQIQAVGVGIREPLIARPLTEEDQRKNMRVEFRLIRVSSEAKVGEFDFDF